MKTFYTEKIGLHSINYIVFFPRFSAACVWQISRKAKIPADWAEFEY